MKFRIAKIRSYYGPFESWEWLKDERSNPIEFDTEKEANDLKRELDEELYVLYNSESSRPEYCVLDESACEWLDHDDPGKYDWDDYSGDDGDEDAMHSYSIEQDIAYIKNHEVCQ